MIVHERRDGIPVEVTLETTDERAASALFDYALDQGCDIRTALTVAEVLYVAAFRGAPDLRAWLTHDRAAVA